MRKVYKLLILQVIIAFSACGPGGSGLSTNQSSAMSEDGVLNTLESALSVANSAFNDVERVNTLTFKSTKSFFNLAYAASCGIDRFSPSIGSANCNNTENQKTVLAQFSGCTAGIQNDYSLNGTVKLSFNSSSTCDSWITGNIPTSGDVTRTTSEFTRKNSDNSTITIDSNSHVNYDNTVTIGGGIKTIFQPTTTININNQIKVVSQRYVQVDGMQRIKKLSSGTTYFEHLIKTNSPLSILGSRSENYREVNGSMIVYHNKAKYTAIHSFSHVTWASNCCYPTEGTVTTTTSGSLTGTISADFKTGTCGEVNVTANTVSTKIKLAACE